MKTIVTPGQMRVIEDYAINNCRVPSLLLMDCAGGSVCGHVQGQRPLVVCGAGNNGGDGYSAARHMAMRGMKPVVWAIGAPPSKSDALTCYKALTGSGVEVTVIENEQALEKARAALGDISCAVDALFGTGLSRELTGVNIAAVRCINSLDAPVIAVDVPSGINAETGDVLGEAVRADVTVTFQYAKTGHYLGKGREYSGRLTVEPIASVPGSILPRRRLMESCDKQELLPPRPFDANKGAFGKALIIAGSEGMGGAAVMCAMAALRSGTGLLTLALPKKLAKTVWPALPEVMVKPLSGSDGLREALKGKTCAAIGPGLGSEKTLEKVLTVSRAKIPIVIDADGLNAIAGDPGFLKDREAGTVLTPHPGEMARLLGCEIAEVLKDPEGAAVKLAQSTGAAVLLKGAVSIAAFGGELSYIASGGPMLAKGGSGDVLTGIILALLSQGLKPFDAARLGAQLLGEAAEKVPRNERAVIARDVIDML